MPVTEKTPGPGGMPKQLAVAMVQRDWQVKKVCLCVSVAIVDERDEKTKSQREIQVVRTCCVNGRPALCFLLPSKSLCSSPVTLAVLYFSALKSLATGESGRLGLLPSAKILRVLTMVNNYVIKWLCCLTPN